MSRCECQVAIVGAGPAGLATAIRLRQLGVDDVLLIDREASAGGIPRHCGHSPFGMREFYRPLSGPAYVRRLARQATSLGVTLSLNTTVVEIAEGGRLTLSTPSGEQRLHARRVVLCTGNRETPRSARLVSGARPQGILTTGALQSMVYLKQRLPFRRPLVVGSELVSFSALLTCRHAGIRPVAMVEANERVTAFAWASLLPRLLGIPLLLNSSIASIAGKRRVESVEIEEASGQTRRIDCDGVLFTGRFVSESSLVRASHLQLDRRSGGPVVDQYGRCTDPHYYACGNLLHPVDTAGWCWSEGRRLAARLQADLNGALPAAGRVIEIDATSDAIRYFTPQRIVLPQHAGEIEPCEAAADLQLRFNGRCRGRLCLSGDQGTLTSRKLSARAETRQLLRLPMTRVADNQLLSLEWLPDQ